MIALDIATAGPYNVFLLLGLILGFSIAWRDGRQAGAPGAEWAALLTLAVAAGLVGARLLHFDPGAPAGAKTILGGVVLGSVALFAGSRVLRVGPRALDALAPALPLGFAVGRIGCLLAGCCFGHPTELPWGAIYDAGSPAFRAHLEGGLIGAGASESLPVHPTQLYEAALALVVAGALPRLRRIVHRPGSLLLTVLLLLALGRLPLEFFRARDAVTLAGLTQVQWLIGAIACATALLLVLRERRAAAPARTVPRACGAWLMCATGVAPLMLLAAGPSFSPLERLVLGLVAVPPLIALLLPVLRRQRHALATPAIVPCALLVIAIQQSPDSTRGSGSFDSGSNWTLGFSVGSSSDMEERVIGRFIDDCGSEQLAMEMFDVQRRVGGAALTRTKRLGPGNANTIRLRGFAGSERAAPSAGSTQPTQRTTLGGIGTSLTLDYPWIGVTGGIAAGRFSGDSMRSPVAAIAGMRVGGLEGVHAFAGINDVDPLGDDERVMRVGLGYGFENGNALRAGLWQGDHPFIGGTLTRGAFEIEPSIAFGDEYDFRLSVRRRFALPSAQRPR